MCVLWVGLVTLGVAVLLLVTARGHYNSSGRLQVLCGMDKGVNMRYSDESWMKCDWRSVFIEIVGVDELSLVTIHRRIARGIKEQYPFLHTRMWFSGWPY